MSNTLKGDFETFSLFKDQFLSLDFPFLNVKAPSILTVFGTKSTRGHWLAYIYVLNPYPLQ
jgi:hypothetical protein